MEAGITEPAECDSSTPEPDLLDCKPGQHEIREKHPN